MNALKEIKTAEKSTEQAINVESLFAASIAFYSAGAYYYMQDEFLRDNVLKNLIFKAHQGLICAYSNHPHTQLPLQYIPTKMVMISEDTSRHHRSNATELWFRTHDVIDCVLEILEQNRLSDHLHDTSIFEMAMESLISNDAETIANVEMQTSFSKPNLESFLMHIDYLFLLEAQKPAPSPSPL